VLQTVYVYKPAHTMSYFCYASCSDSEKIDKCDIPITTLILIIK